MLANMYLNTFYVMVKNMVGGWGVKEGALEVEEDGRRQTVFQNLKL